MIYFLLTATLASSGTLYPFNFFKLHKFPKVGTIKRWCCSANTGSVPTVSYSWPLEVQPRIQKETLKSLLHRLETACLLDSKSVKKVKRLTEQEGKDQTFWSASLISVLPPFSFAKLPTWLFSHIAVQIVCTLFAYSTLYIIWVGFILVKATMKARLSTWI